MGAGERCPGADPSPWLQSPKWGSVCAGVAGRSLVFRSGAWRSVHGAVCGAPSPYFFLSKRSGRFAIQGGLNTHVGFTGSIPGAVVQPQNSRCCPKTLTAAPSAQRGRAGAHGATGSRLGAGCLGVICGGEPTPETQFGHASCPSTALPRSVGCRESGAGLRGPGERRWRSLCRAQGVVVMSAKQELGLQ